MKGRVQEGQLLNFTCEVTQALSIPAGIRVQLPVAKVHFGYDSLLFPNNFLKPLALNSVKSLVSLIQTRRLGRLGHLKRGAPTNFSSASKMILYNL